MSSHPRQSKAAVVSDFRRAQILDAARQQFVRFGVTETTIDAVAKSAGVAKGTVYLYFASKDEILQQVLIEDLLEFHESTVPAIQRDGPIDVRLRDFFTRTLEFFDRKRDFFEHCHLEMTVNVRKKAKLQLGQVFAAQTVAWRKALEGAGPQIRETNVEGSARVIVSLIHGLAMQRLRGWQTGSIAEIVDWACGVVLHGVATP